MRRSFRVIARTTAGLLTGSVVVLAAAYLALVVAGYKPAAVYSGSMEPALGVGSLVVTKPVPSKTVRVGDVITFSDPYVKTRLVTHRIVRVLHTRQGIAYWTKGDANATRDPWTIKLSDQVGRLSFDIPFAGYALVYIHTREIRTALIVVASLILLGLALRRIWREDPAPLPGAPV